MHSCRGSKITKARVFLHNHVHTATCFWVTASAAALAEKVRIYAAGNKPVTRHSLHGGGGGCLFYVIDLTMKYTDTGLQVIPLGLVTGI